MMSDSRSIYRMLLRILPVVLVCFLISPLSAQKQKKNSVEVAYGDEYFKNGDFFKAEQYYQSAYKKQPNSSYITYHIAECQRLLFNYEKAEQYYGLTLKTTTGGSTDYALAAYWHAYMQKMNGKYEEANTSFDQFITTFKPADTHEEDYLKQARIEKEGCEFALTELKRPLRDYAFKVLPTPVNTKFSDYSPAIFHHDSSIVLTSARENTVGGNVYDATGESFSDNLRFEKKKDGKWAKSDNKDGFDDLVNSKYNDGAGVFSADKKKFYFTQCNDDQGACAIYVTKLHGKWSPPVKLNDLINEKGGWNAQPALNHKGDTLYFVSKRAGGQGQHDIWYSVSHKGEDHWEQPVNLGSHINTPFIDMAPSYRSQEHCLFFSSTGHKGFGGLDIFMAKGDSLQYVSNMGLPFNSNKDDFYFVTGEKLGYLTSNRDGGAGNDDIYVFNIESKSTLLAIVKTDTLDTLAVSVSVKGKIIDDSTLNGVPDLENVLTDDKGNVLKKSKTNKDGDFRYDNLDNKQQYKVLLEEKNASLTKKKNYVVTNVQIIGSKVKPSKSLFENIYFDFDKGELRPEATKVLDELAGYCKKNPHVQVELNANTDNYGSDQYNVDLSRKRGEAAIHYLAEKGVDRSTLVVDARGEGKPTATNTNEIGRQLNRRVEFFILGAENFHATGMVYILQPKNTLFSIAKEHGMTVEELKAFNGLEGENIKAFSPIRVPRNGDAALIDPVTQGSLNSIHSNSSTESIAGKHAVKVVLDEGEKIYTVVAGNTFFSIAKQFGMTIEELKELNGLTDVNIKVGQRLKVKKK